MNSEHIELPVRGMSCGGCAQTIQLALAGLEGVTEAKVGHTEAKAQVSYEPQRVNVGQMQEAIRKAGYEVGEPMPMGKGGGGCGSRTGGGCCCS